MKKHILLAFVALCLFTCLPAFDARAEEQTSQVGFVGPQFVLNAKPHFIKLKNFGLSVAVDGDDMVINYGQIYFTFEADKWYIADDLTGPWVLISQSVLPSQIAKRSWEEIRKHPDIKNRRREPVSTKIGNVENYQREASTF
ncbi:MAG: hypothetical protein HGB00_01420 [Chlorobiaceae bacterium]|nr:hypothetical protein [Chlorobiaceae bacterium]